MYVLVCSSYHVTEAVQPVVSNIVVVGVLTHCALLHSMCNLKAIQMNVKQLNTRVYTLQV